IKSSICVPILTDIHEPGQAGPASEVVDVIQIPAFLCRQTDLLVAAAKTGKPVNIKKGQFLAPDDMAYVVEKATASGSSGVLLTERGAFFGYHDLVVDMRALVVMRSLGWPVLFDVTHSLQQPGGAIGASGGQRRFAAALARAAVACGVDGLFVEVHPRPETAISDAATQLPLDALPALLEQCVALRQALERAPQTVWDDHGL
ncbi:MAG: 3-deoxy-8-phosphooctulonate synthase, partial [Armatimonadetes bacterium]|nr:3-deoxy-8-phosphooctulonate synthase [Armatimonadota bacterium]